MTDWTARSFEIKLDFLGQGGHDALIFRDGANASRFASDYKKETARVVHGDVLKLDLAPGGGWAAVLSPQKD